MACLTAAAALSSQFGGKIYHIEYDGSPQAYNMYLPTAQQIIDSFNVGFPETK
jgi:hypothetical protein